MKRLRYAGVGSRNVPVRARLLFNKLGEILARFNCVLFSGGAPGSDEAFEFGCDLAEGEKKIFIPWKGFNGSTSMLVVRDPKAFEIAKEYHPCWERLSQGAQKLMARNSCQVLDEDLETPIDFLLCYTERGKSKGGTAQALKIATDYGVPIWNAGAYMNTPNLGASVVLFLQQIGIPLTDKDVKELCSYK